jgi:hypothetical protein
MTERLDTLKKARDRMLEERDVHAKVLAAPFDRDKGRTRAKQIRRDSGIDRCARSGDRR